MYKLRKNIIYPFPFISCSFIIIVLHCFAKFYTAGKETVAKNNKLILVLQMLFLTIYINILV